MSICGDAVFGALHTEIRRWERRHASAHGVVAAEEHAMPQREGRECATSTWRRSSHSNTQGNQCVEVAAFGDRIALRDSKNPDGPVLLFSRTEWKEFIQHLGRSANRSVGHGSGLGRPRLRYPRQPP